MLAEFGSSVVQALSSAGVAPTSSSAAAWKRLSQLDTLLSHDGYSDDLLSAGGPASVCRATSPSAASALSHMLITTDLCTSPTLCWPPSQVLAYYWQLYLQNALQQSGGALPMPFLGAPPFMAPDALAGQYQQQAQQAAYNGGRASADGTKKRLRDGEGGSSAKKGRRTRNENKVGHTPEASSVCGR